MSPHPTILKRAKKFDMNNQGSLESRKTRLNAMINASLPPTPSSLRLVIHQLLRQRRQLHVQDLRQSA